MDVQQQIPGAQKLFQKKIRRRWLLKHGLPIIINGQHLFQRPVGVCCVSLAAWHCYQLCCCRYKLVSLCRTHGKSRREASLPTVGDAGSPILYVRNLRFTKGKWCAWHYTARFPNSPTLKPQARPTVPQCLLSTSMGGRTLKCPPRGALTSQSENQFPGLDVEGDGSNEGLELPLNGNNDINQGFYNVVSICISYVNNNYHWHGIFREYELLMPTIQLPKKKKERKEEKGKRKRHFPCSYFSPRGECPRLRLQKGWAVLCSRALTQWTASVCQAPGNSSGPAGLAPPHWADICEWKDISIKKKQRNAQEWVVQGSLKPEQGKRRWLGRRGKPCFSQGCPLQSWGGGAPTQRPGLGGSRQKTEQEPQQEAGRHRSHHKGPLTMGQNVDFCFWV